MSIKNVVICAAGFGSRLGLNMPKCLVPFGQHKLIYYILELVKDIPNVRVVVGYKDKEVIDYVKSIRKDVVFIRNKDYATTSNSQSLHLGSKDLTEPFFSIDGDLIIDPNSFKSFAKFCEQNKDEDILGVTLAKTDDAVFTLVDNNQYITKFSRERIDNYEWSGLAYFSQIKISDSPNYVFEQVTEYLPILSTQVICWEIDTPNDLTKAQNEITFLEY